MVVAYADRDAWSRMRYDDSSGTTVRQSVQQEQTKSLPFQPNTLPKKDGGEEGLRSEL